MNRETVMRKCTITGTYPRTQVGVGLIEVLIAVLVFSVGLLGMMSMQLAAKRASFESTQRTIATGLVRDILERIRSNPGALSSYVVNNVGASSLAPGTDCNALTCTTSQLAAWDLYEWVELLRGAAEVITIGSTTSNAGGLVAPQACITHNVGKISVAIAWRGVSELANPTGSGCGNGSGYYGVGDVQRRLLLITTYVGVAS